MRVALVYPKVAFRLGPPVGLVGLASFLKSRLPQHEVEIVDGNFQDPTPRLIRGGFDLIGVTSMTYHYEEVTRMARRLKSTAPVPIVLGGVQPTALPASLRDCFDYAVLGEGEETLCELVHALDQQTPTENIPGLAYRRSGELVTTAPRPPLRNLSLLPSMDYGLLDPRHWKQSSNRVWRDVVCESFILTSRGCPYKCIFCSATQHWGGFRYLPVPWVIQQMEALAARGVDHLQIFDECFFLSKKRLAEMAQAFRQAGLHRHFKGIGCQGRVSQIDNETCELLRSMNVSIVSFGFESGNDRVLKYLKGDNTSVAQNRQAVQTCRSNGLRTVGFLMMGSPTETVGEMNDTLKFARWCRKQGVEDLWPYIAAPYPGTEFWKLALARGRVRDDMNFDHLLLRTKFVGKHLMLDPSVSEASFHGVWFRLLLTLLPFKIKKLLTMLRSVAGDFLRGRTPRVTDAPPPAGARSDP